MAGISYLPPNPVARVPERSLFALYDAAAALLDDQAFGISLARRAEPGMFDVLGMSARTTQRRLREEGTSYAELLETVRRELAMRYLEREEKTAGEIAALLGYGDTSAFHRAFRKWSGTSPRAYRAKHAGDEPRR